MYKIDNKYQKAKIKNQSRGWIFKNTVLKKRRRKNKVTRIIKKQQQQLQKNIYMAFALKIGSFFF